MEKAMQHLYAYKLALPPAILRKSMAIKLEMKSFICHREWAAISKATFVHLNQIRIIHALGNNKNEVLCDKYHIVQ